MGIPDSDSEALKEACINYAEINPFPSARVELAAMLRAIERKNGIVYDEKRMEGMIQCALRLLKEKASAGPISPGRSAF